jgi:hypothetical protein
MIHQLKNAFKVIKRFEKASGAKLNTHKTEGLWVGSWRGRKDKPVNINWQTS